MNQQQNPGSQQKQSGQSNQTVGQGKSQAQFGQAGQEKESQSQEKSKGMDDSKMRNAGASTGSSSGFESSQVGQQRSSGNTQQNRPSGTDVNSGKMNSNQSSQNQQGQ